MVGNKIDGIVIDAYDGNIKQPKLKINFIVDGYSQLITFLESFDVNGYKYLSIRINKEFSCCFYSTFPGIFKLLFEEAALINIENGIPYEKQVNEDVIASTSLKATMPGVCELKDLKQISKIISYSMQFCGPSIDSIYNDVNLPSDDFSPTSNRLKDVNNMLAVLKMKLSICKIIITAMIQFKTAK